MKTKRDVSVDLIIAMSLFVAGIALSLICGVSIVFALLLGLLCFAATALYRGCKPKAVLGMLLKGARRALPVIEVMVLVGLITALWRSGGTIAYFVYYGISFVKPELFLLAAFVITCVISYALGTSVGATGTAGVIFMALSRFGGVNPLLCAGIVMSGAYFGDRCAPTSSSANLVAATTGTNINDNVRLMHKTALIPMLLCTLIYGALSYFNPLSAVDESIMTALSRSFVFTPWLLLPLVLLLVLPLFKIKLKLAMAFSIAAGLIMSIGVQGMSVWAALSACVMGFTPENDAIAVLSGGGLKSMITVCAVLLVSCAYSGIFDGTGMLEGLHKRLTALAGRIGLYPAMLVSGAVFCALFCSQAIAVIMGEALMGEAYAKQGASRSELAIDIENAPILIAAMVPWSAACAVPLAIMEVSAGALGYAVYLYLMPLMYLFLKRWYFPSKPRGVIPPRDAGL